MQNYPYDRYLEGVVTLSTAANRVGLCHFNSWFLELATDNVELDGIKLPMCRYVYYPNLDRLHYLVPSVNNPKLFIPTKERTIVDYVKLNDRYGDEGILIESLQSYLHDYGKDLTKLYEVASFYNLPKEQLDYWINEAKNESYMSEG